MNVILVLCIITVVLQDLSTILIIYHLYVTHTVSKNKTNVPVFEEEDHAHRYNRRKMISKSSFKKLCAFSAASQLLWVIMEVVVVTNFNSANSDRGLFSSFLATDILSKNGVDSFLISLLGLWGLYYYLKKNTSSTEESKEENSLR